MGGRSRKSGRFAEVRKPDAGSFQVRFGELMRNARVRKGLTQQDVAEKAFNDILLKSRVSDVEHGRSEPRADTINRFCEALDVPYEEVEALRTPKSVIFEGSLLHLDIHPVPGFTGREDLLHQIEAALWRKGGTAALTNSDACAAAVKGLGGIGKSVLAREYAWRARERYHGVWWVRADTEQNLIDDLIDLGNHLVPHLKDVQEREHALRRALDAISRTGQDRPWLLIYDNAEKPGVIARLTPTAGAHILITSRWPRWQDRAVELPIDVFPEDTAVDFLLAERSGETRESACQLAAVVGYLPLALSHARAYCAETNLNFPEYTTRLAELIQEAPEGAEYPASVFATFSLAIEKAAENCPEAEKLMGIAAFLAPERIPLKFITAEEMTEKQLEKAVAALFKVSLIRHGVTSDYSRTFHVHKLVQEVMRGRLGLARGGMLQLTIGLMREAFDVLLLQEHAKWPQAAALLPHGLAILSAPDLNEHAPDVGKICAFIGWYLYLGGDTVEAVAYCQRSLNILETVLGEKHPDLVYPLGIIATLCADPAKAEIVLQRALTIAETSRGRNHPDTGWVLDRLALFCLRRQRAEEAERYSDRALAIAKAEFGQYHPTTGKRLAGLGRAYLLQGRPSKAEPLLVEAIAIADAVLGEQHPDLTALLNPLSAIYMEQGRYCEAEALLMRALSISTATEGEMGSGSGSSLNNLATLYERQGRRRDAESLLVRALEIAKSSFHETDPIFVVALGNMAALYERQKRYREAEPLRTQVLAIAEKAFGRNHWKTVDALADLAGLYAEQQRYGRAKPFCDRALKIAEGIRDSDDIRAASTLNKLAVLYARSGHNRQAKRILLRAIKILDGIDNDDYHFMRIVRDNYETLLLGRGQMRIV